MLTSPPFRFSLRFGRLHGLFISGFSLLHLGGVEEYASTNAAIDQTFVFVENESDIDALKTSISAIAHQDFVDMILFTIEIQAEVIEEINARRDNFSAAITADIHPIVATVFC